LKANKEKEGVIELPSGLQYKVLEKGSGVYHPTASTSCSCEYKGSLIDGSVFDSGTASFAPNQVIRGWTEAMQLMVQGDKWEMYIPSELGYGDQGSPPKIPGGSVLVFQMEIKELLGEGVPAMKCDIVSKENCSEKEVAYIEKMSKWEEEKAPKELARLEKMTADSNSMKPELLNWIKNRIYLIKQVPAGSEEL